MSLATMPVSYCVGFPEPRRSSRSDQELLSDSVLVSRHGCARLVGTWAPPRALQTTFTARV